MNEAIQKLHDIRNAVMVLSILHESLQELRRINCQWPPIGADGEMEKKLHDAIEAVIKAAE